MTDETMVAEYPDREQRYAICIAQWETIMMVLFGIGLGVALNQVRALQKRLDDVEEFLFKVFSEKEE